MTNAEENHSSRLFLALWPDPSTRTGLAALQQSVHGRRVHPADLHLTLAFLGQQPAAALPALKDMLAHLPSGTIPLTLDRAGYFARNRIAWAGTHSTPPALLELYRRVKEGLAAHGIRWKEDGRAYRPHITLARDASAPLDMVFAPIIWHAREVTLVMSEPRGDGTRYRIIASRRLDETLRVPDPGEDAPLALP